MFKLDLEKVEEPKIKLPTFTGASKKLENSRKNTYFCFIDYAKAFTVWITTNCGKYLKRWETKPPHLPPEKPVCRSRSNS